MSHVTIAKNNAENNIINAINISTPLIIPINIDDINTNIINTNNTNINTNNNTNIYTNTNINKQWKVGYIYNIKASQIIYKFYNDNIDDNYDKYDITIKTIEQSHKTVYNLFVNSLIVYSSFNIQDLQQLCIKLYVA